MTVTQGRWLLKPNRKSRIVDWTFLECPVWGSLGFASLYDLDLRFRFPPSENLLREHSQCASPAMATRGSPVPCAFRWRPSVHLLSNTRGSLRGPREDEGPFRSGFLWSGCGLEIVYPRHTRQSLPVHLHAHSLLSPPKARERSVVIFQWTGEHFKNIFSSIPEHQIVFPKIS